jgi:disulfide bond formation protein DsbB
MRTARPSPRQALLIAWLVASAGMLGSIYFSEGRGWTPCFLCWYQRICLWPLVAILGLAWWHRRTDIVPFVLPQAFLGLALASYQVLIQDFVGRDFLGICRAGPDCARKIALGIGPISIPIFSWLAFVIITAALLRARSGKRAQ